MSSQSRKLTELVTEAKGIYWQNASTQKVCEVEDVTDADWEALKLEMIKFAKQEDEDVVDHEESLWMYRHQRNGPKYPKMILRHNVTKYGHPGTVKIEWYPDNRNKYTYAPVQCAACGCIIRA
jgi:hypothetical protein